MDFDAKYLLFEYIKNNNIRDAEKILSAKLCNVNCRNIVGFTPLHFAIHCQKETFIGIYFRQT